MTNPLETAGRLGDIAAMHEAWFCASPIFNMATDAQGNFRSDTYAARLEWRAPCGASVLFAAGGTGESFSLTKSEYSNVIETATETCTGSFGGRRLRR